jgi:hypothetical protein
MALTKNKLAAATAVAAAFSLIATPVAAAELPRPAAVKAFDGDALNVDRHRRRWRDNDVDAGDVIAGVLVLGAIAAIASSNKGDRDRDRDRDYDYDNDRDVDIDVDDNDVGYQDPGENSRYGARGIDSAVSMCVNEVERRSARVGTVDSATRSVEGWHVAGSLEGGAPYSCAIGNDGRIGEVVVGDSVAGYAAPADGQFDDAYYTSARAEKGYPGDDGRYDFSKTPDFEQ